MADDTDLRPFGFSVDCIFDPPLGDNRDDIERVCDDFIEFLDKHDLTGSGGIGEDNLGFFVQPMSKRVDLDAARIIVEGWCKNNKDKFNIKSYEVGKIINADEDVSDDGA